MTFKIYNACHNWQEELIGCDKEDLENAGFAIKEIGRCSYIEINTIEQLKTLLETVGSIVIETYDKTESCDGDLIIYDGYIE